VHEAAAAGDPKAAAIVIKARQALAIAARNLVAVHAADTVVFSGNALGDVHELVTIVNNEVAAFTFGPPRGVMVTVSQMEGSAGCIGAACLVLGQ
jgi:predicted NBD/HSP70 family sugar kinase